jgi:hypothetical protein
MKRVSWEEAIEIARKNRERIEADLAEEVEREGAIRACWENDDEGDYFDEVSCLETGD